MFAYPVETTRVFDTVGKLKQSQSYWKSGVVVEVFKFSLSMIVFLSALIIIFSLRNWLLMWLILDDR